jgi:hypothetical protein
MITYYKIFKRDNPTLFYIGSTLNFSSRKSHHKKNVNNKVGKLYWTLLYKTIRENGGWSNFDMIKIYETENHPLRFLEEQALISIHLPPLNKNKSSKEKPTEEILFKFKEMKI